MKLKVTSYLLWLLLRPGVLIMCQAWNWNLIVLESIRDVYYEKVCISQASSLWSSYVTEEIECQKGKIRINFMDSISFPGDFWFFKGTDLIVLFWIPSLFMIYYLTGSSSEAYRWQLWATAKEQFWVAEHVVNLPY